MTFFRRVVGSIAFPALFSFYVAATATLMGVVHGTLDLYAGALCLLAAAVGAQMFAMYRELHAVRIVVDELRPKPDRKYGRRATDTKREAA
jgi:ABC-type microcin C transport system permease subunit YejE